MQLDKHDVLVYIRRSLDMQKALINSSDKATQLQYN